MKVIVTGSRDWEGVHAESRVHIILNMILALSDVLGQKLTIVHGDCPTGADRIVDAWALRREDAGVTVKRHPADWRRLGKAAGPIRNQEMIDAGADLCIGFLRANSTGTRHALALARNARIAAFTVPWEELPE
jgi:hypothetical protein